MSQENYSGIKFMTGLNNVISALMLLGGTMASGVTSAATGEKMALATFIGGFIVTLVGTLMFRSSIEMMTAMREIAINTRRGQ